jgi:hypothetical protein
MNQIWQQRQELERLRAEYLKECMQEYDEVVYRPARRQLVRACYLRGHRDGVLHNNGLGWIWFLCQECGGRYSILGPNGEDPPDDGALE